MNANRCTDRFDMDAYIAQINSRTCCTLGEHKLVVKTPHVSVSAVYTENMHIETKHVHI